MLKMLMSEEKPLQSAADPRSHKLQLFSMSSQTNKDTSWKLETFV